MNKEEKSALVDEIAEQLQGAEAIFAVDYRGISVPQAAELRAKLRDADATFRIVKNRLTLRAAEKAGTETLQELLEGPTALAFVKGDAALAAKALNDFARAGDVLEFKGGLMEGQTLSVDEIKSIARLPARDVLHAQVVGVVASPLTGLVRGLNSLIAGLAVQLQQVQEQGLVGAGAEAEAPPAEEAPAEGGGAEAEAPPAEEAPADGDTAPAEEAPAEGEGEAAEEAPPEGDAPAAEASGDEGEDPVEAGDTGSSAAGPEGEHPEEPAEGAEEAAPGGGEEQTEDDEGAAEA